MSDKVGNSNAIKGIVNKPQFDDHEFIIGRAIHITQLKREGYSKAPLLNRDAIILRSTPLEIVICYVNGDFDSDNLTIQIDEVVNEFFSIEFMVLESKLGSCGSNVTGGGKSF